MKTKFIIVIFFLSCLNMMGQSVDDFKGAVSPQVALMNRYGDYPVDLSNGLVDISIPLYTIKTTSLSLPLQLKFHASGLQAKEREGMFGIRWALGGGGSVSRIVKGYPDEYYPFNSLVNSSTYTPDFNTLFGTTSTFYKPGGSYNEVFTTNHYFPDGSFKAAGQYKDTEYDIYSYSLPSGKSGKFIVQGGIGVPMPYEPLKINVENYSVKIVDEDGITYQFGGQYVDGNEDGWITTWHLSSITSANKQDVIQLDYIKPDINTNFWDKSLVISDNLHDNDLFENCIAFRADGDTYQFISELYQLIGELLTDPTEYFKQSNNPTQTIKSYYSLKSIQYNGGGSPIGRVDFSYQNDRNSQPTYLEYMTVSDAQNKVVNKIHFLLKDNLSGNLKLLDKVEFLDPTNSNNRYGYTFGYYDSDWAPACGDLSADCDWWGYYSLGAGGLKSTPVTVTAVDKVGHFCYPIMQIQGGDKHSDETSMKIGMLQSIQYPTGGETEFEYEANLMPSGQACGGLRIKRVKNEPTSGKTESRYYEYGQSIMPDYLYPDITRFHNIYTENEVDCYVDNDPLSGLQYSPAEGSYIQRIFQTTIPGQYTDLLSNTVYYPTVTEHIENPSGNGDNGRTEYQYNIRLTQSSYFNTLGGADFEGYPDPSVGYKQAYVSPKDFWLATELTSKTIYNSTQKIKEYQYEYQPYRKGSIFDMPVFRYRTHRTSMNTSYYGLGANDEQEIMMIYPNQVNQTFAIKHQEYTIGADKLVKETENSYDDNGTKTSIVKQFTYDPDYYLPVSESVTNSNGDVIQTKKQYSFNNSAPPYDEMVTNNILSDVIRTDKYKGNSVLETSQYNYAAYPSTGNYSSYKPQSIDHGIDGTAERRIDNMLYDNRGNPQYMEKDGVTKIAYLWSYNYQYPVAKIEGLTFDEVVAAVGANYINNLSAEINPTKDEIEQIRTKINSTGKMALINTYTYLPLIGMVSGTDPRGVTTTYAYDTFNRLLNIKNDDSKVLNQYKYNYYNQ